MMLRTNFQFMSNIRLPIKPVIIQLSQPTKAGHRSPLNLGGWKMCDGFKVQRMCALESKAVKDRAVKSIFSEPFCVGLKFSVLLGVLLQHKPSLPQPRGC